jgi:hypothetical protein
MAKTLIFLFAQAALALSAQATAMRDPTQPPAAYQAGFRGAAEDEMAMPAERNLQSIIRRHGAKPLAMINGQTLAVGGKIDGWTLVRIGEAEVELKGPGGRETLMLSPAVDKQPAKPASVRRQR